MALRQVKDTPTNTFATLNPLNKGGNAVLSEGNLKCVTSQSTGTIGISTIGVSTGKWYIEGKIDGGALNIGIIAESIAQSVSSLNYLGGQSNSWCYAPDGNIYNNGSSILNTGTTYGTSDVVGLLLDLDSGDMYAFKNGNPVYSGNAVVTGLSGTYYLAVGAGNSTKYVNFGQDHTFGGTKTDSTGPYTDANGLGSFYHDPPAGALALCSRNIQSVEQDGSYVQNYTSAKGNFRAVTWTGNGTAGHQINDVGFKPDLVWLKNRDSALHHILQDSVRGAGKNLNSSATYKEADGLWNIKSFTDSGLELDSHSNSNENGKKIVAWCWKAAGDPTAEADGTGVTGSAKIINEDGSANTSIQDCAALATATGASITPSKVSANRQNGFSIVSYTGDNVNGATVGHGLNKQLDMLIVKRRSNSDPWTIWHNGIAASSRIELNSTSGELTNRVEWNSTAPSDTVFYLGAPSGYVNLNDDDYIAYCWHSVAGYSKFGSYTGNGSSDGPFVHCGFRPAFVMVKRTDTNNSWCILDNAREAFNPVDKYLLADDVGSEGTSGLTFDFLSNGFKLKTSSAAVNASGTYIYLAFAEQPGAFSNAR